MLPDRWVLEMKLKTSSLNAKMGKETHWRMNVCRDRRVEEEGSSWAADGGGAHQPSDFRPVAFEK